MAAARRAEESVSPVLRAKQCAGALAVAMLLVRAHIRLEGAEYYIVVFARLLVRCVVAPPPGLQHL